MVEGRFARNVQLGARIAATALGLFCAVLACSLAYPGQAIAQSKGRMQGQVVDVAGQPLQGVQITASNPEATPSTLTATTDDRGYWSMQGIEAGHWIFTFEKTGYARQQIEGDVGTLDRNPDLDVTMSPAAAETAPAAVLPVGGANQELFEEGNRLFDAADYAGAVARWQEFLSANPDLYQVNLNIGNAYRQMGEAEPAKDAFAAVLDQEPDNPPALFNLGELYLEEGDTDSALQYLERFVEGSPGQPEIHFNVAELYFARGLADKAIENYRRALELNPDFLPAQRQIGYAYLNVGDNEKALEAFERFLEIAPEDNPNVPVIRDIVAALKGLP